MQYRALELANRSIAWLMSNLILRRYPLTIDNGGTYFHLTTAAVTIKQRIAVTLE